MIAEGPFRVGGTLHAIWKPLIALAVLDVLVVAAYKLLGWHWLAPADLPLPLMGTGLVVFVGLRNSTAYARWWEARALWGAVVNQSRSFARTMTMLLPDPADAPLCDRLIEYQMAWANALRRHLRRQKPGGALPETIDPDVRQRIITAANPAFAVQRIMAESLGEAFRAKRIDSIQLSGVNTILTALTDAQGGLERIRNTPMPQHYSSLPRIFVLIYSALVPFGIVEDVGWLTPVACLLIAAVFLTLDRAGAILENPFERSVHDLPMTAICRTIEIDLKQTMDHPDQPVPVRPVFGVLR